MRTISFLVLSACLSHAQTPTFEVASVKPNKSGTTQANVRSLPNGVEVTNLPLRGLIQLFFQINQPSKVIGIPDWTVSERFDVSARAAGPVSGDDLRLMMQTLIKDRFHFVARREKRELTVLALVLDRKDGKLGPKLAESKGCRQPNDPEPQDASATETPVCGIKPGGTGRLLLVGAPIASFANLLGLAVGKTAVDRTGLTARYDIELTFTPEQQAPAAIAAGIPAADPNGPSIYTALREQLGLKLESQRDEEEVLVVEHIERPTPN